NDTAGIGWAAGIERLSMLLTDLPPRQRTIAIVPMGAGMEIEASKLAMELRDAGYHVDYGYKGKVGQRLKRASQNNARFAVMLGEDELAGGKVILRDLDAGEQQEIARSALQGRLPKPSPETDDKVSSP
ncbi:MAG: His/Gly/Thr/Pro-type tRNA ligase C-terminal domain-containing protein, partial [Geminicoccaceae bacterium]